MTPPLPSIIAEVRSTPRMARVRLEEIADIRLTPEPRTEAFAFYTANARTSDGASLAFDYREPRPRGGATSGPLLNIFVRGICIPKAKIEHSYGPLEVTDTPHGHSWDEQLSLTRKESWGQLSFGFAGRQTDCLSTVSFSYDPEAEG